MASSSLHAFVRVSIALSERDLVHGLAYLTFTAYSTIACPTVVSRVLLCHTPPLPFPPLLESVCALACAYVCVCFTPHACYYTGCVCVCVCAFHCLQSNDVLATSALFKGRMTRPEPCPCQDSPLPSPRSCVCARARACVLLCYCYCATCTSAQSCGTDTSLKPSPLHAGFLCDHTYMML